MKDIKNEEAATKAYNANVKRLNLIIDNLKAQQEGLENEHKDLKKCISV